MSDQQITPGQLIPNPWDHRTHINTEIATWAPPLSSMDRDITPGFSANRGRARDLAIVNPWISNAAQVSRDNVVGRKFTLVMMPDEDFMGVSADEADAWAHLCEAEWRRYAEGLTFDADATRKSRWTFLLHQVQEGLFIDGEALGITRSKLGQYGYLTCLQLIEPERLDDKQLQRRTEAGLESRFGVVRDEYGEPIAYDIRDAHPSDARWSAPGASNNVRRIDRYSPSGRQQVLLVFDEMRPGMTRGISRELLSTLKNAKMLSMFEEANLSRSVMAASWAAVIESEMNYDEAMRVIGANGSAGFDNNITAAMADYLKSVAPYYNQAGLKYNGAKVVHLMPGDALKIVQSQVQGAQIDHFEQAFLRNIAAGAGHSYEELSRDYSKVTYAAARQASASIWRRYMRQREMLTSKFAMPFVSNWLEEAIVTKRLPMLGTKFKPTVEGYRDARHGLCVGDFISWGKPSIDPVKETTGAHMQMALGLTTLRDEAAQQGSDYSLLLRQRAREVKERAKYDLNPLGFDPSLMLGSSAKAGNPQEARAAKKNAPG